MATVPVNAPQTKVCSKCKDPKPLYLFHRRADSKDGHAHMCLECSNEKSRVSYRNSVGNYTRAILY